MSQYIYDRWSVAEGFPRGPVYAISQTPDGYLWIGTESGLLRFDGWNFRRVVDKSGQFTIESVLGLMPDGEGNLWLRLPGPRMLRYRNGIFDDPIADQPYANITAMCRTKDGRLLAAASERGAVSYENGGFRLVADASLLPRSPVISVVQTPDGEIWMGTRDAGLFRMSGGKAVAVNNGLSDHKVNFLLGGPKGELWAGTDNGVVHWNGHALEKVETGINRPRLQVLAMVRDRDANLWLGTDSAGVIRINDGGVAYSTPNMQTGAVTAMFEDREGNIWIGRSNGVERLRDSAFVTYSAAEGLPSDGSVPLLVDSEGRLWFPPVQGGLWWMKDGRSGQISGGGLEKDPVYSLAGGNGELWLGRQRGGLTRIDTKQASFPMKTYTQADGLAQNSVYSVYRAKDGSVWAGTLSGGVSRFREGRFTTFTMADGLGSNMVSSIWESADGTMWFGTPGGLTAFHNGRWRTYTNGDGLPSINVNCLFEDSRKLMWAGTATGLAFLDSDGFRYPSESPIGLREQVLGLEEDEYGSFWISTPTRVLRVSRQKLLEGKIADSDVREYMQADGLRGTEGVRRHRSVVKDTGGRIWFSLNRGISMVDPNRLARSAPAITHVQSIAADGTAMEPRGKVRVPAGSQRVTLGFAGLNLSIPERVRFRYTLDPFDRGWSEPVAAREAMYTNLNPGAYRFRVIASNAEGAWNGSEATLDFVIEPAYWQTMWFRLSLLTAIGIATAAFYRTRLRRLTGELSLRFEERLAERTRIAQELHDTLLQGFLSASMQLHVAVDRLPEESPAKPQLARVQSLMGQVIEEGRNAVRGLRSSEGVAESLEQAFAKVPMQMAEEVQASFRVIVDGQSRRLHPVFRDEVYRIGREALMNAFRHSRAEHIEVELEYASRRFSLRVRDNGCGIDPNVRRQGRDGHWGLPGMQERAERIGGQLHVWSSAQAGTEVELSVPGRVAYAGFPAGGVRERLATWLRSGSPKREEGSQ